LLSLEASYYSKRILIIMTALLPLMDSDAADQVVQVDGTHSNVDNLHNTAATQHDATTHQHTPPSRLPEWCHAPKHDWGEPLQVAEWKEGNTYRLKHGWQGRDLMHDTEAPVRIWSYHVNYGPGLGDNNNKGGGGGVGTTLKGMVHFTTRAESHAGYCHGGSMTSVMDDVIGWTAFLVTGQCLPWTGFTVQVNCNLQKAIPVNSVLMVQGTITKVERRKVSVEAVLVDPSGESGEENSGLGVVHATATGLVVLNRGVLPET
jgi:acyl-coenzyme A thioesterase PaaI-like protein